MSILKRNYEISIWEDEWDNGKFVEKKIFTIGSSEMETQSRAIKPILSRNVNGVKTLSFKLYKKYIDNVTGEKVDNIYAPYLINERKVKLKYKDKWYDFIIKNIIENTKDYLYTYELEDANVQELSKNGFNVTLDPKRNTGTINELAATVLDEVDWELGDSEVFVEKVEEALIYIKIPAGFKAAHLLDQDKEDLSKGVSEGELKTFENDTVALAFYSSCTNQPYRF
jgi:hypothetical protein